MRLLTGPPASGKSTEILNAVRLRLKQANYGFRLLVPTATMARHVQRVLAQEGYLVPSASVGTIAAFLESLSPESNQPSPAAHQFVIRQVLTRLNLPEFRALAASPGLIATLARAQVELFNAGCDALRLQALLGMGVLRGPIWRAFASIAAAVETEFYSRGAALRAARVASAAAQVRRTGLPAIDTVLWDGFFSLTSAERELAKALALHAQVTIALPEWAGSATTLSSLTAAGARMTRLSFPAAPPAEVLVQAPTIDDEVDDIALRIRQRAAGGRPWRDFAIVLRSAFPYLPLLRATLTRFGIPARYYFTANLSHWGASLPQRLATPLPPGAPLHAWQSHAALHAAAQAALEDAAQWLDPPPATVAELALRASEFLANTPVRPHDGRDNTVAVVDVYEARQWRVPEVSLCGLLEGQFPKRPAPEPLLTGSVRRRLAEQGIPVDTDADRRREEEFLFEFARTRATSSLTLSWHSFGSQGGAVTRSHWLDRFLAPPQPACPVRIRASVHLPPPAPASLLSPESHQALQHRHATLRTTAIESFLQCPFQFYGRSTLRLAESLAEEDPLDARELGSVIHRIIAAWYDRPAQSIESLFESEWARFLTVGGIAPTYRVEFARSSLLRALRNLAADPHIAPGWHLRVEQAIDLTLAGTRIRARIDRYDVAPDGRVRAYDFKFSAKAAINRRVRKTEDGLSVQGGLYCLALERQGLRPVSFEYAALRGELAWKGWETPPQVRSLIHQAVEATEAAIPRILSGVIQPDPADETLCRYCEFRDACRSAGRVLAVTPAAGAAS